MQESLTAIKRDEREKIADLESQLRDLNAKVDTWTDKVARLLSRRFLCVAVVQCFAQWRNVHGHGKVLAVPRERAEVKGMTRKEREYKDEALKTKAEVAAVREQLVSTRLELQSHVMQVNRTAPTLTTHAHSTHSQDEGG